MLKNKICTIQNYKYSLNTEMKKKQKEKKDYEMVFDFIYRVNKVNRVVVAFNYVKQFLGMF